MSVGARMRVPYLDLGAQYRSIKTELHAAIDDVFERNAFVLGPAVERFERDFADFCENAHCVAVNNGTAALHVALLALGVGPGDEVITQANTFIATVAAIVYTGATPVLVDADPHTYAIDTAAVERAVTSRTKVIVPVHLFGQPCELEAIEAIAARHGVAVLEDSAQAHGATYHGHKIGSRNIAAFSFYPGKNLGAAGEGGAVVVREGASAERMRLLRNHGSKEKYVHDAVGYNYRLEGLQGAILGVKLRYLQAWTDARAHVAQRYDAALGSIDRPHRVPNTTSAHHIYPILVDDRERVIASLKERGVDTNVHYPVPCHLQPGYAFLGYRAGAFPVTESLAARELSLPIYPEMTDEQIDYVSEAVRSVVA